MINRRGHDRVWIAAMLIVPTLALGLVACDATPSATPVLTPSGTPVVTLAPTEAPSAAATSSPTATTAAGLAPCEVADLKASHGPVEGGAGSIMTMVVLVAAVACSVDAFPALGLRDAGGAALVGSSAGGPGRIDLVAGNGYESAVRLANWCADEPTFPVTLEVVVGGAALIVTSTTGDPFPEDGNLPPCSGDIGPILEATAWAAAT